MGLRQETSFLCLTCGRTCVQTKPSHVLSVPGREEEEVRSSVEEEIICVCVCVCYHESFDAPVERVQQYTGHRAGLGCPVPAIRAVDQNTDALIGHRLDKERRQRRQNQTFRTQTVCVKEHGRSRSHSRSTLKLFCAFVL